MSGFGDDSRFPRNISLAGFGAPSIVGGASVQGQIGFGGFSPQWLLQGPRAIEFAEYPDEGGVVVRVLGLWLRRGPWVVRITGDEGETFHPSGAVGCYSGIIGQGHLCQTDLFRRVLAFALPRLEPGEYSIWIDNPALGLFGANRIDGLLVVPRNHADEVYRIRRTFPARFATGNRRWSLEDAGIGALPVGPLETFTRALGQVLQQTAGSPQTRLLAPVTYASTEAVVESVLAFPPRGEVWIGEHLFAYESRAVDPPTLGGISLRVGTLGGEIPSLTEVTFNAASA